MDNLLPSEKIAVVATIDPDAYGAGAQNSDVVDMSNFESLLVLLQVGDIVTTGTVDLIVQSSAVAAMSSPVTVKSITQLTAAGTDSDKQVLVNVRGEHLTEGHRYVRVTVTFGVAGADAGLVILGVNPFYSPASNHDLDSVDEIVSSS
jgi:hypothetical protein